MVEVHGDGNGGLVGDRGGGRGDRAAAAVVELHRVLADLQDHRPAGLFGAGDDGLGVLEGDDVERHDTGASTMRGSHEIGSSGDRHLRSYPLRCWGIDRVDAHSASGQLRSSSTW